MTGGAQEFDAIAAAFADVNCTFAQAVEQAGRQAEQIVRRAQDHAKGQITSAEERLAVAERTATDAEQRAAAAEARLNVLLRRVEEADTGLRRIGQQAREVLGLVGVDVPQPSPAVASPSHQEPEAAPDASRFLWDAPERSEAAPQPQHDALLALDSLRLALDTARLTSYEVVRAD